jgi:para-nitrobenzyl esterase
MSTRSTRFAGALGAGASAGRRRARVALAVFALAAIWVGDCRAQAENRRHEVVAVETGVLRGVMDDETVRFLGVPFAAPPVGSLRWAPPQPAARWSGVRDASRPASPAAQGPGELASGVANEDCRS